jgi:hypothetical protein
MKIVLPILTALIVGITSFYFFQKNISEQKLEYKLQKLRTAEKIVQGNFDQLCDKISRQLNAFAETVASDKNFALRVLAENDRSSTDVTELAARFISPMDFSVLEITDSGYNILSSGHFVANAGNSVNEKAKLNSKPTCFDDNIMGQQRLTLQSRIRFTISEIPFFVLGGLEVNEMFLRSLTPNSDISVLLKKGKQYCGKSDISSISEINNNRIIINDKEYWASELKLPYIGTEEAPSLIIYME